MYCSYLYARKAAVVLSLFAGQLAVVGCSSSSSPFRGTTVNGSGLAGGGTSVPSQISVTIAGPASVRLGAQAQFTAQVAGSADTQVSWQVDGVEGGNATAGTISVSGLYLCPTTMPSGGSVTITAVADSQPSASASFKEVILNPAVSLSSGTVVVLSASSIGIDVQGAGFISGTSILVNGAPISTTVASSTEVKGTAAITSGATSVSLAVENPDPGATSSAPEIVTFANPTVSAPPTVNATAAGRLLDQMSFGPTAESIQQVEQEGLKAYLLDQLAQPASLIEVSLPTNLPKDSLPVYCLRSAQGCVNYAWWDHAITGPDQLRQRVAFALSQIFVASEDSVWIGAFPYYWDVLMNDAFTNWSTIMQDVTLSPAMGVYLNMMNSAKAPAGSIPNENFARESMQLFSIGINQLNMDGTPVLDTTGQPVPNYTEAQVESFARVYTGWTSANADGSNPGKLVSGSHWVYTQPMVAVEKYHDQTAKTLLRGTVLAAGQTTEQDLEGALTNVFEDPSLPPFVCKQLIQHLVTSQPSPAYVARVAQVFANDGTGVRGDMGAVLTAILLDPEAREGDDGSVVEGAGHLREPILWLTAVMRGLEATKSTGDASSYQGIDNAAAQLSEPLLQAPSVFNYFPPSYQLPDTSTLAPEFSLENSAMIIDKLNIADQIISNTLGKEAVDLSSTGTLGQLAAVSADALLDRLSLVFLHGEMSADMRNVIKDELAGISDPAQQVRVAVYLVITSPQFKVIR